MDGTNRYELTEIDKILGMGMLSDSCGAAELINVLFIRYNVIVEIMWHPNIGKWCPNVRTIAFEPRNIDKKELGNNIRILAELYKNFRDTNYYKALNAGIRIAELYVIKQLIYRKDKQMNDLIHDQVKYERITELLDNCDVKKYHTTIEEHTDIVVNEDYVTGSIKYQLTKYIKENGWK